LHLSPQTLPCPYCAVHWPEELLDFHSSQCPHQRPAPATVAAEAALPAETVEPELINVLAPQTPAPVSYLPPVAHPTAPSPLIFPASPIAYQPSPSTPAESPETYPVSPPPAAQSSEEIAALKAQIEQLKLEKQRLLDQKTSVVVHYPKYWEPQDQDIQLFTVDSNSNEWIKVAARFLDRIAPSQSPTVVRIQRVQNRRLWYELLLHLSPFC